MGRKLLNAVFVGMLLAGWLAVVGFSYLHHQSAVAVTKAVASGVDAVERGVLLDPGEEYIEERRFPEDIVVRRAVSAWEEAPPSPPYRDQTLGEPRTTGAPAPRATTTTPRPSSRPTSRPAPTRPPWEIRR